MQPASLVPNSSLQRKKVYDMAGREGRKATKNFPLRKLRQTPSCPKLVSPGGARISKVPLARSIAAVDRLFESSFLLRFDIALKSKPISVPR